MIVRRYILSVNYPNQWTTFELKKGSASFFFFFSNYSLDSFIARKCQKSRETLDFEIYALLFVPLLSLPL